MRVHTASRAEVYLLGGPSKLNMQIGLGQRLDYTDDYGYIPLQGFGKAYTQGHEPGIHRGSGDIQVVRLDGQSLRLIGFQLHKNLVLQLNETGLELVIRDKRGNITDQLTDVKFNQTRTSMDNQGQLVMEDVNFVYIRVLEDG